MEISKEQGQSIKGIAILLIIIHNYVYILLGINNNEMNYSISATRTFLDHLFTPDVLLYIVSFAGWIGVPLFFFLSGYGLTRKYGQEKHLNARSYVMNHLVKLWMLLLPIYLVYCCIFTTNIQSPIAQMTFTINILSYGNNGFYLDPGVYWFFGAILQFYLLFLVFRRMSTRGLWVLCAAFVAFHYFALYSVDVYAFKWVRHNFLGWGSSFVLGMIAARSRVEASRGSIIAICITAFVGLCLGLVIKWLAPFAEICVIIFLVTLTRMVTTKWLCFLGIISPSIFALHPFIRQVFYSIFTFGPDHPYLMTLVFVATTLIFSWVHHRVLKKANAWLKRPNR